MILISIHRSFIINYQHNNVYNLKGMKYVVNSHMDTKFHNNGGELSPVIHNVHTTPSGQLDPFADKVFAGQQATANMIMERMMEMMTQMSRLMSNGTPSPASVDNSTSTSANVQPSPIQVKDHVPTNGDLSAQIQSCKLQVNPGSFLCI